MNIQNTCLSGLIILEPKVFGDHRGWFMESYKSSTLKELGLNISFVQDNHSFSQKRGTLRGLHYQINPKAQTKLVRCTSGVIFDVAVDLRKGSRTYGKWYGIELSAENKKQLLIPKGFAHGFMTLTENVEVEYKVDEVYNPDCDRSILWNDKDIMITWPLDIKPLLSLKDENAPTLKQAEINFTYGDQ